MSLSLIVTYTLAFFVTGAVIVGACLVEILLLFALFGYIDARITALCGVVSKVDAIRVVLAFVRKHTLEILTVVIVLFFGVFFVGFFGFLPTNNPNSQFLPPLFSFPPPEPPPACP